MNTNIMRKCGRRGVQLLIICGVLVAVLGACRGAGRGRAPATQVDRLMQVYPELQSGRFLVIADFEDAAQMDLFQLVSVSDSASCVLDAKKGRRETGGGCAHFTTGSPDDTIVITNASDAQWYLKRDWRAYDLLLMSVHSPVRGLSLNVTVGGGPADLRTWAYTDVPLERGWNVIRLDLAEVGEKTPLDDVREMRLAVSGASKKVRLRFDDILLAYNREDVLGNSRNTTGDLYLQRAGRRWNIGAGGRFELTMAGGQIVRWFNLAADPHRLRNLVEGTVLGPSPVVVDTTGSPQSDFSALGKSVVVRQRIEEMSPVRVVVWCEWRFTDDPAVPPDDRPFQRWVYTIYPTGQMFVEVEATAAAGPDWSPQLGLAVTFASAQPGEIETRVVSGDRAVEHEESSAGSSQLLYATARSQVADSFLMYVPFAGHTPTRIVEQVDPTNRRTSFVVINSTGEPVVQRWVSQITFSLSGRVPDDEAASRAADYIEPAPIELEIGSPVVGKSGGARTDGFDAATGCYVLAPEGNRVRFVLDCRKRPCFSPAFCIARSDWQEAWVYVDHLIFDAVARDARGQLIFQLPETITDRTTVEVLFRQTPPPEG